MNQLSQVKERWDHIREPVLSVFIAFNLIALTLALFPDCKQRDFLIRPLESYVWAVGLWQGSGGGVFAPDPPKQIFEVKARVRMQDGTVRNWQMWDASKYDLFTRFCKGRWRKLNMFTQYKSKWLPDVALYAARQFQIENNPPVFVEMVRRVHTIPAPGSSKVKEPYDEVYFSRSISAEDLK